MGHRTAHRKRRATQHGDTLRRLLSLPARRNARWPFVAAVMAGTTGLYLQVLLTAPPMPPGNAPAPESSSIGQPSHRASGRTPDALPPVSTRPGVGASSLQWGAPI